MALAKCGIPWELVMELDPIERRGMVIAAGIVDGGTFDWNFRQWKQPNA